MTRTEGREGHSAVEDFDVAIVGARCAGASLAVLLAARGLSVVVVDKSAGIGFTLSSNILQADSLSFLRRVGAMDRLRAAGATTMSHIDMRLEDFHCHEELPQAPGDAGGAACIRREILDSALVDTAAAAGAEIRLGTKVVGLIEENGRVAGVRVVRGERETQLRARLVVGADGRNSWVADACNARRYHVLHGERSYYWTYFQGADLGTHPTFVFHRWGDRHMLGGPADNGLYILGVSPQQHERDRFREDLDASVRAHVEHCPPIAEALADAERATKIYGVRRFFGYFREAAGPGWVLLGDAGHFKDPAGGRGIGDAFHQAEHLAPRIERALTRSGGEIDRVTREFVRWRDRTYAEYYGLAADLGVAGPIAAVVPQTVRRMHAKGRIDDLLNLLSHRSSVLDVLSPARVLHATGGLLRHSPGRRKAVIAEMASLVSTEIGRRRAMRRPVHQSGPVRPPVQPDLPEAELSR
ncbi:NAD(P)/FAD-dependent oxidoreductase [Streptomyces sp. NPDC086554]|uniref:NAD(P)/FAD-dependent oxidoreductase n=1 Tax=Streptomyces sp. NPDC086554 TaxID=3154864 RepID=UPI00341A1D1B